MPNSTRQYDIVLFGATGYTGKLTAQYVARKLPTDIKWAIAGRSERKLEAVAATCKEINPDRVQPAIEVCNLDDIELSDLARKTTILVSTVGPYSIYGEHAVKACAENGTHYFDVTGECAYVHKMIKKYEKTAQSTGAIIIPQIGVESAPADLVTWSLVSLIRRECSAPTADVVFSVHELNGTPSGGTLATVFALQECHTVSEIMATNKAFAMSPIPGPQSKDPTSIFTKLFGVISVPDLGILSTSIAAMSDVPIVQRSWGLFGGPKLYGPRFHFREFMKTRNYFTGIFLHFAIVFGAVAIALAPLRWLFKKLVTQPGFGPEIENTKHERLEYRAVAHPDSSSEKRKSFARVAWEGSMYEFTATLLGQACLCLLKDDVVAKKLGGGILTPATLGQPFIDRLGEEGFKIELRMMEQ